MSGRCKSCKQLYDKNSPQLDYDNWEKYGFKGPSHFKKHNSGNKKCPCKNGSSDIQSKAKKNDTEPFKWPEYDPSIFWTDKDDYVYSQETAKKKKSHHEKKGDKLWYSNQEEVATEVVTGILDRKFHYITLVAQPGAGKTGVIHNVIFWITSLLSYEDHICPEHITVTTGMSDTDWQAQFKDSFKLRNKDYLWTELNQSPTSYCLSHRSNFHKRVTYLINNPKNLFNHVFVFDESHIADGDTMTFNNELYRLGLTSEKIKKYNIKIINVSATPDVHLDIFKGQDSHLLCKLKNGDTYKGFKYFNDKDLIIDYNKEIGTDSNRITSIIRQLYTNPRYHFIRARHSPSSTYRTEIIDQTTQNDWKVIEDDSRSNIYLSSISNEKEDQQSQAGHTVIKLYEPPDKHTIILLKNKYLASKRLILTPYIGIICEKPSKKMNTTVTAQGLTPRWFCHGPLPDFIDNECPQFLCNKKCIEEYLKFTENDVWSYDGIDYHGKRITAKHKKIANSLLEKGHISQLSSTVFSSMEDITPDSKSTSNFDFRIYKLRKTIDKACDIMGYGRLPSKKISDGFYETSVNSKKRVRSVEYIYDRHHNSYGTNSGKTTYRSGYPCYRNIGDPDSLYWFFIIRPEPNPVNISKLPALKDVRREFEFIR